MRKQRCFRSIIIAAAIFLCAAAFILSAQTDLSGYLAFRVKDGGVNYYQMQQNGESFGTVPAAAGRGGRGGRLAGTVKNGKVHLEMLNTPPAAPPPAYLVRPAGARPRRLGPILKPACMKARSRTPIASTLP